MKKSYIKPSPNEEAQLLKKQIDEKKKFRLMQVRQQEKEASSLLHKKIQKNKNKQFKEILEHLKEEFDDNKLDNENKLLDQLNNQMKKMGECHKFNDKENFGVKKGLSHAMEANMQKRFNQALTKVLADKSNKQNETNQELLLRQKIHEMEDRRRKEILAMPKIIDPIQMLKPVKVVSSFNKSHQSNMQSFATTRFHMALHSTQFPPEVLIERPCEEEQVDAKLAAEDEQIRCKAIRQQYDQEVEERQEKAELRHQYARQEVLLKQQQDVLLDDLKTLELKDRHRRKQIVADVPKKIYQSEYQRYEDDEKKQHDLEQVFERMYNMKNDDPMQKYYANIKDLTGTSKLEDTMKSDTSKLEDAMKSEESTDVETGKQLHEELTTTKKKLDDKAISQDSKLSRLRNRINQQKSGLRNNLKSANSSSLTVHTLTDAPSANTLASLQSMNLDSACESFKSSEFVGMSDQEIHFHQEQPTDNKMKLSSNTNTDFNQRLLEHQKRIHDYQKRHLDNQIVNKQIVDSAMHQINVILPQVADLTNSSVNTNDSSFGIEQHSNVPTNNTHIQTDNDIYRNIEHLNPSVTSFSDAEDIDFQLQGVRNDIPSSVPPLSDELVMNHESPGLGVENIRKETETQTRLELDTATQTSFMYASSLSRDSSISFHNSESNNEGIFPELQPEENNKVINGESLTGNEKDINDLRSYKEYMKLQRLKLEEKRRIRKQKKVAQSVAENENRNQIAKHDEVTEMSHNAPVLNQQYIPTLQELNMTQNNTLTNLPNLDLTNKNNKINLAVSELRNLSSNINKGKHKQQRNLAYMKPDVVTLANDRHVPKPLEDDGQMGETNLHKTSKPLSSVSQSFLSESHRQNGLNDQDILYDRGQSYGQGNSNDQGQLYDQRHSNNGENSHDQAQFRDISRELPQHNSHEEVDNNFENSTQTYDSNQSYFSSTNLLSIPSHQQQHATSRNNRLFRIAEQPQVSPIREVEDEWVKDEEKECTVPPKMESILSLEEQSLSGESHGDIQTIPYYTYNEDGLSVIALSSHNGSYSNQNVNKELNKIRNRELSNSKSYERDSTYHTINSRPYLFSTSNNENRSPKSYSFHNLENEADEDNCQNISTTISSSNGNTETFQRSATGNRNHEESSQYKQHQRRQEILSQQQQQQEILSQQQQQQEILSQQQLRQEKLSQQQRQDILSQQQLRQEKMSQQQQQQEILSQQQQRQEILSQQQQQQEILSQQQQQQEIFSQQQQQQVSQQQRMVAQRLESVTESPNHHTANGTSQVMHELRPYQSMHGQFLELSEHNNSLQSYDLVNMNPSWTSSSHTTLATVDLLHQDALLEITSPSNQNHGSTTTSTNYNQESISPTNTNQALNTRTTNENMESSISSNQIKESSSTLTSSLTNSSTYQELLERVRQLPLKHLKEQQTLIESFEKMKDSILLTDSSSSTIDLSSQSTLTFESFHQIPNPSRELPNASNTRGISVARDTLVTRDTSFEGRYFPTNSYIHPNISENISNRYLQPNTNVQNNTTEGLQSLPISTFQSTFEEDIDINKSSQKSFQVHDNNIANQYDNKAEKPNKSLTITEKSPTITEKSPTITEKSPTLNEKSPAFTGFNNTTDIHFEISTPLTNSKYPTLQTNIPFSNNLLVSSSDQESMLTSAKPISSDQESMLASAKPIIFHQSNSKSKPPKRVTYKDDIIDADPNPKIAENIFQNSFGYKESISRGNLKSHSDNSLEDSRKNYPNSSDSTSYMNRFVMSYFEDFQPEHTLHKQSESSSDYNTMMSFESFLPLPGINASRKPNKLSTDLSAKKNTLEISAQNPARYTEVSTSSNRKSIDVSARKLNRHNTEGSTWNESQKMKLVQEKELNDNMSNRRNRITFADDNKAKDRITFADDNKAKDRITFADDNKAKDRHIRNLNITEYNNNGKEAEGEFPEILNNDNVHPEYFTDNRPIKSQNLLAERETSASNTISLSLSNQCTSTSNNISSLITDSKSLSVEDSETMETNKTSSTGQQNQGTTVVMGNPLNEEQHDNTNQNEAEKRHQNYQNNSQLNDAGHKEAVSYSKTHDSLLSTQNLTELQLIYAMSGSINTTGFIDHDLSPQNYRKYTENKEEGVRTNENTNQGLLSEHSITDSDSSSKLFTVGKLTLNQIQLTNQEQIRTDLSMLSDLDFSSMSEVNWTTLLPSNSSSNQSELSTDRNNQSELSINNINQSENYIESQQTNVGPTLQDAFLKKKKQFIENSKTRKEQANEKAIKSYERGQLKKILKQKQPIPSTSKQLQPKSMSSTHVFNKKRLQEEPLSRDKMKESKLESKQRTKSLYMRLPEVQKQLAEKERVQSSKRNRERMQEFHEKIQRQLKKRSSHK